MSQLTVVQADIAAVAADAVVNPTNSGFSLVGECGKSLEKRGGKEFAKAVADLSSSHGQLANSDGEKRPPAWSPKSSSLMHACLVTLLS